MTILNSQSVIKYFFGQCIKKVGKCQNRLSETLGLSDAVDLLQETPDEEKAADEILTKVARSPATEAR